MLDASARTDAQFASLARLLANFQNMNDSQADAVAASRTAERQAAATVAGLTVELNVSAVALKAAEGANAYLHGEVDRLRREASASHEGCCALAETLRARLADVATLTAERDALDFDLSVIRAGRDSLGKEVDRLRYVVDRLNAEDERMRAERDEALSHILGADEARDEARAQRDDCAHLVDKLRAELHDARAEAARVVDDLNARNAAQAGTASAHQAEAEHFRGEVRDLRGLLARVYLAADSRTLKRREIADMLAPHFTDRGAVLENREAPELPAGFIGVNLDELPEHVADAIRFDAPKGSNFVEVSAACLPDDTIRSIFAIAPLDGAQPVEVARFTRHAEVAA